jgi:hypothetical protein
LALAARFAELVRELVVADFGVELALSQRQLLGQHRCRQAKC